MKNKGKKKAKNKSPGKRPSSKEQARRERKLKRGKRKASIKTLLQQIRRLNDELQLQSEEIKALKGANATATTSKPAAVPAGPAGEWPDNGSIGERKKTRERHQYLCARYDHHLEAGCAKSQARTFADRDLRERYGEQAGYTAEQLEAILS